MGWRDLLGAGAEADTDRDGVLSSRPEWHAAIVGLAVGVTVGASGMWELGVAFVGVTIGVRAARTDALEDVTSEPWYALGLFLAGLPVGAWTTTIIG